MSKLFEVFKKAEFSKWSPTVTLTTPNNAGVEKEIAAELVEEFNNFVGKSFTNRTDCRDVLKNSSEVHYLAPYVGDSGHAYKWDLLALLNPDHLQAVKHRLEKEGVEIIYSA